MRERITLSTTVMEARQGAVASFTHFRGKGEWCK